MCSSDLVIYKPLPQDDPTRRRPDIAQAQDILKWQPKTALDDGLARTVDYFRALLKT